MSDERRRALAWAAAGLVVLGVAVGAFSLGRGFAGPQAAAETSVIAEAGEELPVDEAADEPADEPDDEGTNSEGDGRAAAAPQPFAGSIVVYISGAVAYPDTYSLPADARVKDVVVAAGGLTGDAAADRVNLAERIADAQHIHIPRVGDIEGGAAPSAGGTAPAGAASGRVNLNSASAAELEELPRIGTALATRIIEWRDANGPFKSIEDIQQVKGVSAAVFDEIKDLVSVE